MSHGPDLSGIVAASPRALPKGLVNWCMLFLFLGVFGAHWSYAQWPERAMGAFLTCIVYFLGVCQGGFMFAVSLTLTQGRWGRPLKRIAECFAIMVPVIYIGLLSFLVLGGLDIFPWTTEEMPPHKAIYLNTRFFMLRQVFGLLLVMLLSLGYLRASWRPDLGMMKARLGDDAPGWYGWFIKDFGDLKAEVDQSVKMQRRYGAILSITYALVFSMIAIDLEMSLAPHWFANMFPAWFFMSSFWSGIVVIGIYSLVFRKWLGIESLTPPAVYHDLGKLTFAFCMFWGYTTYAQYLAIWYGNMTEETGFILLRTQLDPWADLAKVVVLCCFLIPWTLLLSRSMKKIRSAYLAVSCLIAIGIFLERFLVTMPSIWMGDELPLGVGEMLMPLGFAGTMVLLVSAMLSQIPPVPITDPYMKPNPLDFHIHPSSRRQGRAAN
jgi:hypothetical protein